ncbi:serine hydrolase domain-containing protein [Paenibacillus tarimensis]|uniref:serine hydrolase domain-containing protein n=1 Tax=Paenibacillus tarimensis TaxID=416012 RepID=UPI001F37C97E|nr:serine hydrolase domain-containing protein [Paenibacillus tarimensis]MCF2945330.1 beta-lactamase family protein [Paenibacillus tarimensis]
MKGKRKRRVWRWLGILTGTVIAVLAGATFYFVDWSNPKDLNDYMAAKLDKANIPGMAAVIIKDNRIERTLHYGYADKEAGIKVDENTIFQIASVSKTVTAAAVMKLEEQGVMKLDDAINTYLPEPIVHPDYPDTPITFRMLLSHTSGIEDNQDVYEGLYTIHEGGGDSPVTLEELVREYFRQDGKWYDAKQNFTPEKPGTAFAYSNIGYGLLGYLVEQLAGMSFDQFTREQIFEPLGMEDTYWFHSQMETGRLAIPYDDGKPLPPYSFATYPDGALKTTPEDYAKFMISMMPKEGAGEAALLQQNTIRQMLEPTAHDGKQAMGWSYSVLEELRLGDLNNGRLVGHGGSDPGVFTLVLFDPAEHNGMIIFMNQNVKLQPRVLNVYMAVKRLVSEAFPSS